MIFGVKNEVADAIGISRPWQLVGNLARSVAAVSNSLLAQKWQYQSSHGALMTIRLGLSSRQAAQVFIGPAEDALSLVKYSSLIQSNCS